MFTVLLKTTACTIAHDVDNVIELTFTLQYYENSGKENVIETVNAQLMTIYC